MPATSGVIASDPDFLRRSPVIGDHEAGRIAFDVEITLISGEPVEHDDRLEDAHGGHAGVGTGGEDALLGGEGGDQQIGHLPAAAGRRSVFGVRPDQRCCVQPLADMLADPGMAVGALAIFGEEWLGVHNQQPVLRVRGDPRSQPAVNPDLRRREDLGRVREPGRHHEGDGSRVVPAGVEGQQSAQLKRVIAKGIGEVLPGIVEPPTAVRG